MREIKKDILNKVEEFLKEEKASTETKECPECGGKYLVATGYCVGCKKKVAEPKKEAKIKEGVPMSFSDYLLQGIDYEEIIDTTYSNYGEGATERDVMKTFDDILKSNLQDAKSSLRKDIKFILDAIKFGY